MKPRLVVFAKAPVIGGAKTRLARGIGKVAAWRHYRAMTARVLRRLADPRWETVLAVSPDAAAGRRFPGVWPAGVSRLLQGPGDLGERQARVFSSSASGGGSRRVAPDGGGRLRLRMPPASRPAAATAPPLAGEQRGRRPVIVIGTDAPQVTRADIAMAVKRLKRHDAVIGPAEDGGYWLLALNAPVPPGVFEGIRWSHAQTQADLEARLKAHGLGQIAHLRVLRDVDEAADL